MGTPQARFEALKILRPGRWRPCDHDHYPEQQSAFEELLFTRTLKLINT